MQGAGLRTVHCAQHVAAAAAGRSPAPFTSSCRKPAPRRARARSCQAALLPLQECRQHDLLQLRLADGTTELLGVQEGWDAASQSVVLCWKGQLVRLAAQEGGGAPLSLAALGLHPSSAAPHSRSVCPCTCGPDSDAAS